MENITEKEKRLDKMSATFEELKDGILRLKNVKSEYSQAAIILLRNVFSEREQKLSEQQGNCNLPHVINALQPEQEKVPCNNCQGCGCTVCGGSGYWLQ